MDLIELESGKITRSWNVEGTIFSLAFRPDGAQLAGAGYDDTAVHVWDVANGKKLHTYKGIAAASCVAFSPDGHRLAGMGYSGELHLWYAGSGQEMLILRPFAPPPGSLGFTPRLAFSPDGSRIAANSASGIVSVWDAGVGAVPAFRELEPELSIDSLEPGLTTDSPDAALATASPEAALATGSLESAVLKRRAELAVRLGRWNEAVDDGSRLLEHDPDDLAALLIRARQPGPGRNGTGVERRGTGAPARPRIVSSWPRPGRSTTAGAAGSWNRTTGTRPGNHGPVQGPVTRRCFCWAPITPTRPRGWPTSS